jgi:hypothetical protein
LAFLLNIHIFSRFKTPAFRPECALALNIGGSLFLKIAKVSYFGTAMTGIWQGEDHRQRICIFATHSIE